jgi:hypothetical protein
MKATGRLLAAGAVLVVGFFYLSGRRKSAREQSGKAFDDAIRRINPGAIKVDGKWVIPESSGITFEDADEFVMRNTR